MKESGSSGLLGDSVHLRDCLTDLADARTLLGTCLVDLAYDVSYAFDSADDLPHGAAGRVHQRRTPVDLLNAGSDQVFDLLGGLGTALRKAANFIRNDGKAPALFSGTDSLDRGNRRQDSGLEADAGDHADDVRNAFEMDISLREAVDRS